jgi:hypothetical protein
MAERPKMDFSTELTRGIKVHSDLRHEILVTTSDKLRLCLQRHQTFFTGRTAWLGPSGILLAFLCALVAADFKDFIVSKDTWKLVFTIGIGVSGLWLALTVVQAIKITLREWATGSPGTIDGIVKELKAETTGVASLIAPPQVPPAAPSTALPVAVPATPPTTPPTAPPANP